MPYVSRVASGRLAQLSVYGSDYDTPDGTGVRHYIHVDGLRVIGEGDRFIVTWNLGTGRGHSALDVIATFERVNGVSVPYRIVPRRPCDVASCYASVCEARSELGWHASLSLERWWVRLGGSNGC